MLDDKHFLVGGTIVAVRSMSSLEAEHCGFVLDNAIAPTVLVVRPKGGNTDDSRLPTIVPLVDTEGKNPGCLWVITPSTKHKSGLFFPV